MKRISFLSIMFMFYVALTNFAGTAVAQTPGWEWAKAIGSSNFVHIEGMSSDNNDNIYITGYFNGTVDFDPGSGIVNLSTATSFFSDIFVVKYSQNGNLIWARAFTAASTTGLPYNEGNAVSVDAAGNVYTTGVFQTRQILTRAPEPAFLLRSIIMHLSLN